MTVCTLRCRGPHGQVTLADLDADMSINSFLALLQVRVGISPDAAELLTGFPPKPVLVSWLKDERFDRDLSERTMQMPSDLDGSKLSDLGLRNGDTFTLRESAPAAGADPTAAAPAAAPVAVAAPPRPTGPFHVDEDADLARALAASMEDTHQLAPPPPSGGSAAGSGATAPSSAAGQTVSGKQAPSSVQLPDGSCVVRRIIDSDNSCLFNAVGYVMERTRLRAKARGRDLIVGEALAHSHPSTQVSPPHPRRTSAL